MVKVEEGRIKVEGVQTTRIVEENMAGLPVGAEEVVVDSEEVDMADPVHQHLVGSKPSNTIRINERKQSSSLLSQREIFV